MSKSNVSKPPRAPRVLKQLAKLLDVSALAIMGQQVYLFIRPMSNSSVLMCAGTTIVDCTHWLVVNGGLMTAVFLALAGIWGAVRIVRYAGTCGFIVRWSKKTKEKES